MPRLNPKGKDRQMADALEGHTPSKPNDADIAKEQQSADAVEPKSKGGDTPLIRFSFKLQGDAALVVNNYVEKINRIANREVITASAVVRDFLRENPDALIKWVKSQTSSD